MPQMAPINWLNLYFIFISTFMMFNIMNYFIFNATMPKSKNFNKTQLNSLNWKW